MKFSLFFLARNKNNKASTSEITASKQAKQLLQLVFFFLGGGGGGIETDLKRGPSSCPLGSLMDRNAEFSKTKKWWF
jgi:hypothetical protein